MLDKYFIHTVTVSRRTKTSVDGFGEAVYTYANVYTNIPARVEEYNEQTQYRKSNERLANQTIVYVQNNVTINLQDKITWVGNYLGLVSGVNTALAPGGGVDHYEVIIENP